MAVEGKETKGINEKKRDSHFYNLNRVQDFWWISGYKDKV